MLTIRTKLEHADGNKDLILVFSRMTKLWGEGTGFRENTEKLLCLTE